ncbi:MAG: CPBP family intramembrane metalloprotease [Treponema sp.]|nr:CPBP family intramembrane metalloprotease [Treponema sp.]
MSITQSLAYDIVAHKGGAIKGLLEAASLFFVFFFPRGTGALSSPEEIRYTLFWRLPAIILLLLLLGEKASPGLSGPQRRRGLAALGIAFPSLFLTGFLVSLGPALSGRFPPVPVPRPSGAAAWISAVLLSLAAGFLEEGYFRVYLPRRCGEAGLGPGRCLLVPAFLFALCHAWEGPWGVLNALLSALLLALVYRKTASLYGIALAHGLYNITVYLIAPA